MAVDKIDVTVEINPTVMISEIIEPASLGEKPSQSHPQVDAPKSPDPLSGKRKRKFHNIYAQNPPSLEEEQSFDFGKKDKAAYDEFVKNNPIPILNDNQRQQSCVANLVINQKEFNSQLDILEKKAEKLKKNGHGVAAGRAKELHTSLNDRSKIYFSNPTKEAYITFKKLAKEDIKKAHEELDKHRGWKQILGNIGLAILGFGVLYLVAVLINKNLFFKQTDSAKKLVALETMIDSDVYRKK